MNATFQSSYGISKKQTESCFSTQLTHMNNSNYNSQRNFNLCSTLAFRFLLLLKIHFIRWLSMKWLREAEFLSISFHFEFYHVFLKPKFHFNWLGAMANCLEWPTMHQGG